MSSNNILKKAALIFCSMACLCILSFSFGACSNSNKENKASTSENVVTEKPAADAEKEEKNEKLLYTEALNGYGSSGENVNYQITEVKRGDFKYEMFAIGNVEYRDLYYDTMETEEAEIVEYKVNIGDKVNKGDVILEYKPVYDEAGYKQRAAEVEQKEKEYAAGYDTRRAEIIKAEHELKQIKDTNEKEIKKLEIKKLRLALEKYQETSESMAEQKKSLEEYRKGLEKTEVVASHSGYIMELGEADNENIIRKGNIVAVISPKKDYCIKVNDTTHGMLRYNADVTISVASSKGGDISMPGRVVMCSNILSYGNATEDAYVEILEEPEGVDWSGAIKVYFESKLVKDVLMVDSKAVLFESKNEGSNAVSVPYVYIYDNGNIFKRYIQVFGSNNKDYLVLSGLDEGQKVAIYNK